MRVLYFAWLRTHIGHAEDRIDLPAGVRDVRGLVEHLRAKGLGYQRALTDLATVRVAVNHEYVGFDHALKPGDEVAFFPPVTGG
ncbi:MAG: molybdopterin converting factor subunit 1 [Alphaproteobacteria bacterium]|nr:molybdopterin converting factor subunit 1 [Alphaproteobacteria bacterium]